MGTNSPQSVRNVSAKRGAAGLRGEAQRIVELAQIRPGDHITVAGWPPDHLEVIDTSDRALLTVRAPTGRELKIGRHCVGSIVVADREARA